MEICVIEILKNIHISNNDENMSLNVDSLDKNVWVVLVLWLFKLDKSLKKKDEMVVTYSLIYIYVLHYIL